ncbi:hypothetical protein [Methylobacterium gossipiicola]|uniref:Uncharacterized protein n=1 Tax=Methylobacterium gossipiicola TaxID=582675 RepID=A0A1I2TL22_9HYPH|nr:hypothetical protein [Methylobacterium gossipiicola]SFG65570.1 hypothetical protein SAMN05192565_107186 [Methylobacterium gossipiicola]
MSSPAEGGFYVRQREPDPTNTATWRAPFRHETLESAFQEAERVARAKGIPFSVLQEVGVVDPVFREEPHKADAYAQMHAFLQERLTEIQNAMADLAKLGGR